MLGGWEALRGEHCSLSRRWALGGTLVRRPFSGRFSAGGLPACPPALCFCSPRCGGTKTSCRKAEVGGLLWAGEGVAVHRTPAWWVAHFSSVLNIPFRRTSWRWWQPGRTGTEPGQGLNGALCSALGGTLNREGVTAPILVSRSIQPAGEMTFLETVPFWGVGGGAGGMVVAGGLGALRNGGR